MNAKQLPGQTMPYSHPWRFFLRKLRCLSQMRRSTDRGLNWSIDVGYCIDRFDQQELEYTAQQDVPQGVST